MTFSFRFRLPPSSHRRSFNKFGRRSCLHHLGLITQLGAPTIFTASSRIALSLSAPDPLPTLAACAQPPPRSFNILGSLHMLSSVLSSLVLVLKRQRSGCSARDLLATIRPSCNLTSSSRRAVTLAISSPLYVSRATLRTASSQSYALSVHHPVYSPASGPQAATPCARLRIRQRSRSFRVRVLDRKRRSQPSRRRTETCIVYATRQARSAMLASDATGSRAALRTASSRYRVTRPSAFIAAGRSSSNAQARRVGARPCPGS
ncbi:hypothetical protein EXIGLDRAFT_761995 [Exidia glandulosa HHB12029]|uniref:Uncharacterized protein n=1 Tax=Exidia glandulosa HHB12029 TaxID=1314781 RepID=A0A165N2X1_EXIGL|nr:hypothetical protein EXIGLDRAFT_761995 [Exidia glandulosa HHB12029]